LGNIFSRDEEKASRHERTALHLDTQTELDANVDIPCLLDNLGELHCLVSRLLEVVDGEDLEARVVDL